MGEQRSGNADEVNFVSDMAALEALRRQFTVEEYNKLGEAGVIASDERVELLDGDIIVVPPQGPPHFSVVARMAQRLVLRLGERALVTSRMPVIVSDRSEPEPDIAILARRADFYRSGIPQVPDVFALVEVADSSLAIDRGKKLAIYAEARVEEYWIVDVRHAAIEVYREPRDGGYDSLATFRGDARVSFLAFPDDEFTVDELLG
jgi:Uma2 family endonuclease